MKKPDPARRRRVASLAIVLGCTTTAATAQTLPGAREEAPTPAAPFTTPSSAQASPTPAPPPSELAVPADNTARANELRLRGNRAIDEGRIAEAIGHYEEATKLSSDPRIAYNLGAAYQKVGRNAEALFQFIQFKENASREELDKAPNLDKRIAALRGQVAVLRVNVNVPGARVFVRDTFVGTKPADRLFETSLNEGRAPVEIIHDGYQPYRKEHTLQGGSALELEVNLHRQAAPTTVVENTKTIYVTSTPFWSQWWFWAGAGVFVAGGAAAIYALSTEKPAGEGDIGRIVGPLGTRPPHLGLSF